MIRMKNKIATTDFPLSGLRILEISETPRADICTLMLADYGAEVIKVHTGSSFLEDRCQYASHNRGKMHITLNFTSPWHIAQLQELIFSSHAVVTDCPEILDLLHMGYWKIRHRIPHIVYTAITGYGLEGPYASKPSCDATIQAESGLMSITGTENGPPTLCGGPIADYLSACMGCIGTLTALLDAMRTGTGRLVDISSMDTILYGFENLFSSYLKSGLIPKPIGNNYRLSAPVGVFPCKDGEIVISVATDRQWKAFAEALEHTEWLEDARFETVQKRILNYRAINHLVVRAFSGYTYDELAHLLQKRRCIYGKVNTLPDVVSHPQTSYRNVFVQAVYPDGDSFFVPVTPLRMEGITLKQLYPVGQPKYFN